MISAANVAAPRDPDADDHVVRSDIEGGHGLSAALRLAIE
jgi:hypothetical protein